MTAELTPVPVGTEANVWRPGESIQLSSEVKQVPQSFVAIEDQEVFNLTYFTYVLDTNSVEVFKDGLRLVKSVDWVELTPTSIQLTNPAAAGVNLVIIGLVSSYTAPYLMTALGDGIWTSGQIFTAYNQYLIYNDVPYKPKVTTTLPYTVGATVDLESVLPFALDKDHNDINGREVYGAHDVSSISNGNETLTQTLSRIGANSELIGKQANLSNLNQVVLTAAQQGERLSKAASLIIDCMGDSTMYGYTALTGVQSPNNAPASLSAAISLLFTGSSVVNNRAISGTTLRGMLAGTDGSGSTFKSKLTSGVLAASTIIYCNHGINDSQLDLSINQYRLDVIEFVSLCREYGKTPILVTPNPNVPFDIIDDTNSKRLDLYVQIMREIAKATNTDLVDQNYYINQSTNLFRMQDIVPDGAHLTDDGYRQAGFNLVIPLIASRTLKNAGDNIGLSGSTYIDNLTTNRSTQKQNSRCGVSLTSEVVSGAQGVNYPFILDKAESEVLISTLQYYDTVEVNVLINNVPSISKYFNKKIIGNTSLVDWDALFSVKREFRAGLQILSLLTDASPVEGSYFIFSGVALRSEATSTKNNRTVTYTDKNSILSGDTVALDFYFADGASLNLVDKSGERVITVSSESGIIKLKTWADSSEVSSVDLSGSTIPDGTYPVDIQLFNGQINAKVSGIEASISINNIPNMYIDNPFLTYYRT